MKSHILDYKIIGDNRQLIEIELDPYETVIAEAGSMLFGGEGLFLATIRGTGKVWLQSMPFRKLIQAISPYGKNIRKEGNSLLGDFLER